MCQANTFAARMITVPTKGPVSTRTETEADQKKMIDTSTLKEEDLKTLKEQDPFLYNSIPAVRTATVLNRDVDVSSLQGGQPSTSRRASCPSRIESTPTTKIERRSCISFECHTDLLLEDCIDDITDWNMTGDEFDFDSMLD
jgi:hypothetical protein